MISTLILPAVLATQVDLPFVSPAFSDHMVLQRDRPNPIWGWTTPGKKVTVSIGKRHWDGVADATGKWMVKLSPPAVGGP